MADRPPPHVSHVFNSEIGLIEFQCEDGVNKVRLIRGDAEVDDSAGLKGEKLILCASARDLATGLKCGCRGSLYAEELCFFLKVYLSIVSD